MTGLRVMVAPFVLLLALLAGCDDRLQPQQRFLDELRATMPALADAADSDLLSYGNAACVALRWGWDDERTHAWLADAPAAYLDVDGERLAFRLADAAREHLCDVDT